MTKKSSTRRRKTSRPLFENFELGEEYPPSLSEALAPTHNYALQSLKMDNFPLHLEDDFRSMMAGDPLISSARRRDSDVSLDWACIADQLRGNLPTGQRLPSGSFAKPEHYLCGAIFELVDEAQSKLNANDKDGALLQMGKMIAAVATMGAIRVMTYMVDGFARQFDERHAFRERHAVLPARARHKVKNELKEKALFMYRAREWRSVRQAAATIYPDLAATAKAAGAAFSPDRGQQTVYEWLLAVRKRQT